MSHRVGISANRFYPNIVLVGDGVYADIATCYLASQLGFLGIKFSRVYGSSSFNDQAIIDVDHSIHILNEELEIDFTALMSANIITPNLIHRAPFLEGTAHFESYSYLKDDLPFPYYQAMTRLISEGVATTWESASPLVALDKLGKFHPKLHHFYRGNVRPYGGKINAKAYSKILNEKSMSLGVEFLHASKIEIEKDADRHSIVTLHLDATTVLRDAFFIDMTHEKSLIKLGSQLSIKQHDKNESGVSYLNQPWIGNCLALGEAATNFAASSAPVNLFDGVFKGLVRFVDFFPSAVRQDGLAREYNRLQKNDNDALADFLHLYHSFVSENYNELLPEKLRHRVHLFIESCQLSEDVNSWAYPNYWPTLMLAAGKVPKRVPRRVQQLPLKYLVDWYDQRLHNIDHLINRSYNL